MKKHEPTSKDTHPLFYGMKIVKRTGRKTKDETLKGLTTNLIEILYVEYQLSVKEIASLWSINENTLKMHIYKSKITKRKTK